MNNYSSKYNSRIFHTFSTILVIPKRRNKNEKEITMNIQDLVVEIQSQKASIRYLQEHPKVAASTIMHETPEYCRGALNMLKYLTQYVNMNLTCFDIPAYVLMAMDKYNLEYHGVKCVGVDWDMQLFHFEYQGEQHLWFQTDAIDCNADTDHIRCVIDNQFLPMKGKRV